MLYVRRQTLEYIWIGSDTTAAVDWSMVEHKVKSDVDRLDSALAPGARSGCESVSADKGRTKEVLERM